jgi:hypothetical protein
MSRARIVNAVNAKKHTIEDKKHIRRLGSVEASSSNS